MINNRQNGRRRGRGGGPRSPNNAPSPGNARQDNRSRGNAAQLHEKYKAMARDSQLAGDRVQTEYYLQFADHYFRVLNESRARFEEQRRPRDDYMSDEEEDHDEAMNAADGDEQQERDERDDRPEREPRGESQREPRGDGQREPRGEGQREQRADRNYRNGEARPRRDRPRRDRDEDREDGQDEERISLDVLPPAIAPEPIEAAPAPRRRVRRPRPEGDADIAPAA